MKDCFMPPTTPREIFPAAGRTVGPGQDGEISRSFLAGGMGDTFFAKKVSPTARPIDRPKGGRIV